MQSFAEKGSSLNDYLNQQLQVSGISEEEMKIGSAILDYINQDGYFKGNIEDVAFELKCDKAWVEKTLNLIQTFEPHGVGARDLEECLLIQFNLLPRSIKNSYQCIERILKEYLCDLGNKKYVKLARSLRISVEKLREAIHIIRCFSPKPGASYDKPSKVEYVVPNITVKEIEGKFFILHDTSCYPRLRLSQTYMRLLENNSADENASEYIKGKIDAALWFVKNIEHRHYVVYQIMEKIVSLQETFFKDGPQFLKPLNLKDVAQAIDVHESTVSRAIRNKYVQTKWGVFELKYFFPSMVNREEGDMISNEVIKQMLKQLIESENPQKPYSDQNLTKMLQEKNIKISRRTAAKYRSELGITCASQRKTI